MILVVEAVKDQCDKVVVGLNNYTRVPEALSCYSNVECHLLDNSLGDAAKMLTVGSCDGYYATLDDDLLPPKTFIQDLIRGIDRYNGFISFHGKVYNRGFSGFKKPSIVYRCLGSVADDVRVNFIGTGCSGFHTDRLKLSIDMFPIKNMADVHVSKACHDQGVQMVVLKHDRGYFAYQQPSGGTIWESFRGATPVQDKIMRTFLK